MTSMHSAPHPRPHGSPVLHQPLDLRRLNGMLIGNALKQSNFLRNQVTIAFWQLAGTVSCHVPVEVLAREDNALIGFGGGHGRILP